VKKGFQEETRKKSKKDPLHKQRVRRPTGSGLKLSNKAIENFKKLHKITGKTQNTVATANGCFGRRCEVRGGRNGLRRSSPESWNASEDGG
jgi:hypothetical protein